MRRLTEDLPYPIPDNSFLLCQACGVEKDDICSMNMWAEADEDDSFPDRAPVVLLCRKCEPVITEHERLYRKVQWSRGGPGKFILVCGDCPFREETRCTNDKLRENGGDGLLVRFAQTPVSNTHIQLSGGRGFFIGPPAVSCEGNPRED